jgi:hypothetical protein
MDTICHTYHIVFSERNPESRFARKAGSTLVREPVTGIRRLARLLTPGFTLLSQWGKKTENGEFLVDSVHFGSIALVILMVTEIPIACDVFERMILQSLATYSSYGTTFSETTNLEQFHRATGLIPLFSESVRGRDR